MILWLQTAVSDRSFRLYFERVCTVFPIPHAVKVMLFSPWPLVLSLQKRLDGLELCEEPGGSRKQLKIFVLKNSRHFISSHIFVFLL